MRQERKGKCINGRYLYGSRAPKTSGTDFVNRLSFPLPLAALTFYTKTFVTCRYKETRQETVRFARAK